MFFLASGQKLNSAQNNKGLPLHGMQAALSMHLLVNLDFIFQYICSIRRHVASYLHQSLWNNLQQ